MADDITERRRALQAELDQLQRQEDKARAAAAAAAQGQPLADALQRATAAEARVQELEKQNRRLERTNTKQLQRMQEFTAKHATAVETVLEGVAQQADALQQTSNTWQVLAANAKGFKDNLQSLHLDLVRGVEAKPQQDTSTARLAAPTSGSSSCHMHIFTSALHTPARSTHVHITRATCTHAHLHISSAHSHALHTCACHTSHLHTCTCACLRVHM